MKYSKKILALVLCAVLSLSCIFVSRISGIDTSAQETEAKKDLKILILGNSYGRDSYEYMYKIFQSSGKYNNVTVGDLYAGGQSLQGHVASLIYALGGTEGETPAIDESTLKTFSVNGTLQYHYYKHTGDNKIPYTYATQKDINFTDRLAEENWDVVSIQEGPKFMGNNAQYKIDTNILEAVNSVIGAATNKTYTADNTYIDVLTDYIKSKNSSAKIYWHETFANIDNSYTNCYSEVKIDGVSLSNQNKMFYTMSRFVQDVVNPYVENGTLAGIIPAGTAFEYLYEATGKSESLYRDNIHLADKGRFTAGLAWYTAVSGNPVTDVTDNYVPNFGIYEIKTVIENAVNFANSCIKNGKYTAPDFEIENGAGKLSGVKAFTVTSETRAEAMKEYGIDFYEDFELGNTFKSSSTNEAVTLKKGGNYRDSGFSRSGNYASFGSIKKTEDSVTSYYLEDAYYDGIPAGNEVQNLTFITNVPSHDATDTLVYFDYTDSDNWVAYNVGKNSLQKSVDGTVSGTAAARVLDSTANISSLNGSYSNATPDLPYNEAFLEIKYAIENGMGYYYIYVTSLVNRTVDSVNPLNIATAVYKIKVSDDIHEQTGMIKTIRFGYANTNKNEREVILDQVEAKYYDSSKAAKLISDIDILNNNDTVYARDKNKIDAIYSRYEEFAASNVGDFITNASDIILLKGILDYLNAHNIESYSKSELLDFNSEIAGIGTVHLGKYARIQELYNQYKVYDEMGVADSLSNKDVLLNAKQNVEWLKSNGYYYYDDFDTDGMHGGAINFENVNPYIEEEAADKFNARAAEKGTKDAGNGNTATNENNSITKLADANKVETVYSYNGGITFRPASGYTMNNWLIWSEKSAQFNALNGLKADAYDGQPIYKASFDYDVSSWFAPVTPIIVTSFANENNWKGFSFTNDVYKTEKSTAVDSTTGKETVSYSAGGDITTKKADGETNWVTGYSRKANVLMEYKKADETHPSSDYYLFTITNKDTSDDSAQHGSYKVAYLIAGVDQPLTNLYFGATSDTDSSIDNVIIYANEETGPENKGATILKAADTENQKFSFSGSYAAFKNYAAMNNITGEATYGVKYLGKYVNNLNTLLSNSNTKVRSEKVSSISDIPDDVSIEITNGQNAPGNRISVVFFVTFNDGSKEKTLYSTNTVYDRDMSSLLKIENGIAAKSLTGVTKAIFNNVVFSYQPTSVADSKYQTAFNNALSSYNTDNNTSYTAAVISAVTHSKNKAAANAVLEAAGYSNVDYHKLLNEIYVAMCKELWP